MLSVDWKCSTTYSLLTLVVYVLLVKLTVDSTESNFKSVEWYNSLEFMLLVSAFVAYNVNNYLFGPCSNPTHPAPVVANVNVPPPAVPAV